MSTEIKTKTKGLELNQFSGGTEHGLMIGIHQDNFFRDDDWDYCNFDENSRSDIFLAKIHSNIHLTKEQALQLGKDLIKWSKK